MTIYGKMTYVIKRSQILRLRQPPERATSLGRNPSQPDSPPPTPTAFAPKPKALGDWLGEQGGAGAQVQTDLKVCLGWGS